MRPGYFVAIIIMILIIGEHFWTKKNSSTREVIIIIIAAIAAGAFAGFALEWALGLFRTFMQANIAKPPTIPEVSIITS